MSLHFSPRVLSGERSGDWPIVRERDYTCYPMGLKVATCERSILLEEAIMRTPPKRTITRRSVLAGAFTSLGWTALSRAEAEAEEKTGKEAPIARKDPLKITKLETFLVKPRWLF